MDFREMYTIVSVANSVFKLSAQPICSAACQKPASPPAACQKPASPLLHVRNQLLLSSVYTVAPAKTKYSEKKLSLQNSRKKWSVQNLLQLMKMFRFAPGLATALSQGSLIE